MMMMIEQDKHSGLVGVTQKCISDYIGEVPASFNWLEGRYTQ